MNRISVKRTVLILLMALLFLQANFAFEESPIIQPRISTSGILIPIIMYHQVKPSKFGKNSISPSELENDLAYLTENHFNTITMTQLTDYVYYSVPLPDNPIILTFDDGFLNNYIYAYPLLKKYGMKAVISILGQSIDAFSQKSDIDIDYSSFTWDQLNEMISSTTIEVQNHSYNMHNQRRRIGCTQRSGETLEQYRLALEQDIIPFQTEICQKTGYTPNTYTYPLGAIGKNTDLILRELGFKATLSCVYGINVISKDPAILYRLKRIGRAHGKNLNKLLDDALKTVIK